MTRSRALHATKWPRLAKARTRARLTAHLRSCTKEKQGTLALTEVRGTKGGRDGNHLRLLITITLGEDGQKYFRAFHDDDRKCAKRHSKRDAEKDPATDTLHPNPTRHILTFAKMLRNMIHSVRGSLKHTSAEPTPA